MLVGYFIQESSHLIFILFKSHVYLFTLPALPIRIIFKTITIFYSYYFLHVLIWVIVIFRCFTEIVTANKTEYYKRNQWQH